MVVTVDAGLARGHLLDSYDHAVGLAVGRNHQEGLEVALRGSGVTDQRRSGAQASQLGCPSSSASLCLCDLGAISSLPQAAVSPSVKGVLRLAFTSLALWGGFPWEEPAVPAEAGGGGFGEEPA